MGVPRICCSRFPCWSSMCRRLCPLRWVPHVLLYPSLPHILCALHRLRAKYVPMNTPERIHTPVTLTFSSPGLVAHFSLSSSQVM